jgi:hypothetical protein
VSYLGQSSVAKFAVLVDAPPQAESAKLAASVMVTPNDSFMEFPVVIHVI